MIKDRKGKERFYIEENINKFLMRLKEKVTKEDQEVWVAFGGDTGVGKSLKAQQWGYVIDSTINIKRVCFDKDEFINAILEAKKGEVIVADEGIAIFFSRASMTREGRLIAELVAQIRQKNLVIFLCIPEPLSLDWTVQRELNAYVHIWESREEREFEGKKKIVTMKGNAAIYPEIPGFSLKSRLFQYLRIKKGNPHAKIRRPEPMLFQKGNAIGPNCKKPFYPVGEEGYRKKKESVLEKYRTKDKDDRTEKQKKDQLVRDRAIYLFKQDGKSFQVISDLLLIPKTTVVDSYRRYLQVLKSTEGFNQKGKGSVEDLNEQNTIQRIKLVFNSNIKKEDGD
jgi:hypothetical protein